MMDERVKQKIDAGRQYRTMSLRSAMKEDAEEKSYRVEGYATTFDEEYHLFNFYDCELDEYVEVREVVLSTAFDNCDMSDVIFQYDHCGRVFARNSNDTLEIAPDAHGLHVDGNLGGTQSGRQLYEEIDGGYTTKMSFGFMIEDSELTEEDGYYLHTIKSISKLYDVSAVSLPANDGTEISARNQIDGLINQIVEERNAKIKEERLKAECLALLNL